jgi:hypothetical protein
VSDAQLTAVFGLCLIWFYIGYMIPRPRKPTTKLRARSRYDGVHPPYASRGYGAGCEPAPLPSHNAAAKEA